MNLFPASPAGGVPSYLEEVRSPDKRLRLYHRALADSGRPGGRYPVIISIDASSSRGVDNGTYFESVTSALGAGYDAVLFSVSNYLYPPHANTFFITKFRVLDNTDIRVFFGWTNLSQTTYNDNDTIAGDAVGLQFSTNRGDTNWQLVTSDDGTQTTTDSGLAFSTSQIYIAEIEFYGEGTSVRFRISDENFDVLMGDTIVTENLPIANSESGVKQGIQTLAVAAKTWRFYYHQVWY